MVRIAKETDYSKLEELKEKINDEQYLSVAIQQLAQILSTEMLGIDEENNP